MYICLWLVYTCICIRRRLWCPDPLRQCRWDQQIRLQFKSYIYSCILCYTNGCLSIPKQYNVDIPTLTYVYVCNVTKQACPTFKEAKQ